MAKALGVTARTVQRWELGEVPTPPYLGIALQGLKKRPAKKKAKKRPAKKR